MKVYNFRKNHFVSIENNTFKIRAKLAVKTKEVCWLGADEPAVIIVSIHSHFHEGVEGEMKMEALFSVIKSSLARRATILMTEKAHVHVQSIKNKEASAQCRADARSLEKRFSPLFANSQLVYWEEYIQQDKHYLECQEQVFHAFEKDALFRQLLHKDALLSYSKHREIEYPNREEYIEKTIDDLLEQSVAQVVLAKKGYRYQFYPGRAYSSVEYIVGKQMRLVHVFVTIEKKRIESVA